MSTPKPLKPGPKTGGEPVYPRSVSLKEKHWDYLRRVSDKYDVSVSKILRDLLDQRLSK
jgi:hypothetical protein